MSIADRARTGVRLTLLASLLATSPLGFQAPSGDGPLFQAAKAFAKDGDRDRSDDRDDDRGGRSGSGGRDSDDRDDDRGGGGRGSDDDRSDSGRSSRDDSADRDRSSRDDSADRSRSARDEAEDRSESRGRGSDDDRDDDRNDDGRRGRSGDDGRSGGRSATARAGGSGPGLSVVKIERSSSGLEVSYSNGVREEIENGRYEMKNAAGRTVLERRATQADVDRMQGNARRSGATVTSASRSAGSSGSAAAARLPAGSRPSRIEIAGRNAIEVSYASGWREEVEAGRYELKDPSNRTVVERRATGADLDRLMGLAGR